MLTFKIQTKTVGDKNILKHKKSKCVHRPNE